MTRGKTDQTKKMLYLLVIMIALGVTIYYTYNVIAVEIAQKQVEEEHKALITEKSKLEEELKNVSNPKYIEQQARTQLRMIFPGEVLYVLPDKKEEHNESN